MKYIGMALIIAIPVWGFVESTHIKEEQKVRTLLIRTEHLQAMERERRDTINTTGGMVATIAPEVGNVAKAIASVFS